MKVGYVYDPICLEHDTGNHVEVNGRLSALMAHLEQSGTLKKLKHIKSRAATEQEIELIHAPELIARVKKLAADGGGWMDGDTVVSPKTFEAALYAAGNTIAAAEAVLKGDVDSAFALVRPPGHHATATLSMGFCVFNNIAIATKYIMKHYGLKHVTIIDFDVHHGNGTQEAFYNSAQVQYISTHLHPFYPGSGNDIEMGDSIGRGTTINVPLPPGCGDNEHIAAFEKIVVPAVVRFRPQIILVSAGYDSHWCDNIGLMKMSTTGYVRLIEIIRDLSKYFCEGRLAFTLEGGYNFQALSTSIKATFDTLLEEYADVDDPLGPPPRPVQLPDSMAVINRVRQLHWL